MERKVIRTAVFGFGGLGRGMARLIPHRPDFQLVAVADSQGYCFDERGLDLSKLESVTTVANYPEIGKQDVDSMISLLNAHGDWIDAVFLALPNLPVTFFAETVQRILDETKFEGLFVDALKRTEAVENLFALKDDIRNRKILYITGAGATPGFLTTVAGVAALSFAEVLEVNIHFGVGVSNWEAYKATIREDFIHLKGFDAKRVACMTDEEIAAELEARQGLLSLTDMEHADDVILELAGVCSRDRVTVGGLVDTRSAKKPVSTTVTVKGRTASGAIGEHKFVVSDEATMVDNVCGPALGFLLSASDLYERGIFGLMTSADIMPRFASRVAATTSKTLSETELATV